MPAAPVAASSGALGRLVGGPLGITPAQVAAAWNPPGGGRYMVAPRPVAPMTFDQAVERITAGWRSGGAEGALRAALSDVVPPTDPAQNQALFRPQWLGELYGPTAYTERPLIDVISKAPLTSFTVTGFRVNRPAFGVAPYAGNKAAVPSPGGYAVEVVSANRHPHRGRPRYRPRVHRPGRRVLCLLLYFRTRWRRITWSRRESWWPRIPGRGHRRGRDR